ncbi:MAG: ABC transporter permease [Acidobacteriota bacterium]
MEFLLKDLRQAIRSLRKSPIFTLIALLTLTLGIGANTAIFTVTNGILFEAMPLREAERIVWLAESNPQAGYPRFTVSPPNFQDFREQSTAFESMAAFRRGNLTLTGGDTPQRLTAGLVSAPYFDVIGAQVEGRGFAPEEEPPGAARVTVISHGLWQRQLGSAPLDGLTLTLDGETYEVIGVAPEDLPAPFNVFDLWVPLGMDLARFPRDYHNLQVLARLAPGKTLQAATSEIQSLAARLATEYPETNEGWSAALDPLQELLVANVRPTLMSLLLAVGFVLLIACANLANLLLARTAAQGRELAVRTALGASRWEIMRRVLVESLLLALAGGVLGTLLAIWGSRTLVRLGAGSLPRADAIGVDSGVLVFSLGVSLLTGLLFGIAPALKAARSDPQDALREGGRSGFEGRASGLLRQGLVVVQVALALILVIAAGLLVRSFARMQEVELGFAAEDRLTARLSLPRVRYGDDTTKRNFYLQLLERARALPGVEEAATIAPLPLVGGRFFLELFLAGKPVPAPGEALATAVRWVSLDYFRTMAIPVQRGRVFDTSDDPEAPATAVVNETAARLFWPGENPIGQRFTFDDPPTEESEWLAVIGVVGDVRHDGHSRDAGPEIYRHNPAGAFNRAALILKSSLPPGKLVVPLREAIAEIDSGLPLFDIRTLRDIVDGSTARPRFNTLILGLLAGLALVLAAVGVYGVVSYGVSQRLREIGLRTALGAQRFSIFRLVVGRGMLPVLLGLVAGLVGAFATVRLLETLLFGIEKIDPVSFSTGPVILVAVALIACLLPAWRAIRQDPAAILRE